MSSTAWVLAASDLGIRVTAPYSERDGFGGTIDRDLFVKLLTQWGWSGMGTPPDWYHEP